MTIRKPFNESLFNQNDASARAAVMQYVSQNGLLIQENPDKYGPDLIVYKGFKPGYYIETEVKRVWRADQDQFPWATIQMPERKAKFLKLGKPIEFFILRSDLKMAVVIPDYVVEKSPKKEVPNKLVASGEQFFVINVSDCDIVDLTGDDT